MSSDQKPTPSEPDATSSGLAKSFADRLTFPDSKGKPNPTASTFTPGKFSWADEAETPTEEKLETQTPSQPPAQTPAPASSAPKAQTDYAANGSLETAQKDGATTWTGGSGGLDEPEFDVNVKLADLQDDPNNPLYSIKSFETLEL